MRKGLCGHSDHVRGCRGDCWKLVYYKAPSEEKEIPVAKTDTSTDTRDRDNGHTKFNMYPLIDPRSQVGDPEFLAYLDELRELHLLKSGGYGTGSDPYSNFTLVSAASGEPRHRYPRRRIVEKLARLESLDAQGRVEELEEEYGDIAGLAICALAMLRKDRTVAALADTSGE